MKFWTNFSIIYLGLSTVLFAEEKPEINDFLPSGYEEISKEVLPEEISVLRTSTKSFSIIADDAQSFSQIRNIITNSEKIILEYFGVELGSEGKITLQVISDKDVELKEQFYVEITKDGFVYLMLRWDEHLKHDAFCNFIMGAMLRKLSLEKGIKDTPYFLELSLSSLLEQRTNRSLLFELAKMGEKARLLNLENALRIERNVGNFERNKLSAYWNLIALNSFYKNKAELHNACAALLARGDSSYGYISSDYSLGDFEKYFKCIVNSEISSRLGGIMSMENSADEILRLSFIRKDSKNQAFGDKEIFKNNSDKEVLAAINRRIIEIKLLLPTINPAYFNTLVSLGEMFEAASEDKSEKFEKARQTFINDFRYAKYVEGKADLLLGE